MRFPSRGVTLFLLTWAILWAVPALRHQTQRGWQEKTFGRWDYLWLTLAETPLEAARRVAPNDPFVSSQKLRNELRQTNNPSEVARIFREYDALLAKHPARLDLWRARLRLVMTRAIVHDKHTDKFLPQQASHPPYVVKFSPLSFDNAQLRIIVQQARRAQKLAPDDAFFPFIEAMALSGLNREAESLTALGKAGRCSTFNDGTADEARQKIALKQKFETVDWDEKLFVSAAELSPHFGQMRAIVLDTVYNGVERYRAGDKAEAWRLWKIALEAGRAVRVGQSRGPQASLIGLLVGETLEQDTWNTVNKEIGGYHPDFKEWSNSSDGRIRRLKAQIQVFVNLARRDGQTALVRWSEREMQGIIERQSLPIFRRNLENVFAALGWKTPAARATIQIRWLGAQVVILALVGVVCWAVVQLVTRGGRESRVSAAAIGNLSVFFAALWLGCVALAFVGGAGTKIYGELWNLQSGDDNPFRVWSNDWENSFWYLLGITMLAVPILYFWGQRRRVARGEKKRGSRVTIWRLLEFVTWIFVLFASLALWFDGQNSPYGISDSSVLFVVWLGSVAITLFLAGRASKVAAPPDPFLFALDAVLALGFLVLTAYSQLDWAAYSSWFVGAAAIGLLLWNGRFSLRNTTQIRATIEVGGRVMANLALAISLFYLLASLALWPTRVGLNRNIERYIQMGEVDWMRAQRN